MPVTERGQTTVQRPRAFEIEEPPNLVVARDPDDLFVVLQFKSSAATLRSCHQPQQTQLVKPAMGLA